MAAVSSANVPEFFDLRSAALTLVALVLKTTDLAALARAMEERFGHTPNLFEQDPIVIDLTPVREAPEPIDFEALIAMVRERRMLPVAVKGGSAEQMQAALAAGLSEAPESAAPRPAAEVTAEPPAPAAIAPPGALVIDRPLRSGQQVYARGGDLVVLAVVSFGAEVIADGHIHVYAPLRGRAMAGARGNTEARIFSACMEPQLVSIAGIYRTTETALPEDVLGKPAQVRLVGERLLVEPLKL